MDRQCSSCGGFCKKSGCERENVKPEPEPVAWADKVDIDRDGHDLWVSRQKPAKDGVPLYTTPPQREWVGLTDEEIYLETNHIDRSERGWAVEFARAIEAKLKEKNT